MMINQLFQKRPLPVALAIYLLSAFLIQYLLPPVLFFILILATLILLLALSFIKAPIFHRLRPYQTLLFLLVFVLALSSLIGFSLNARRQKCENAFFETEVFATFRVKTITEYDGMTLASGTITPEGSDDSYMTRLYFFGETLLVTDGERYLPLQEGDNLYGCFSLSAVTGKTLGDLQVYADGYELSGSYLHSAELRGKNEVVFSLQKPLSRLLEENLSSYGKGMMKALLLADTKELSPKIKENFQVLGISHLLAVSGLHLTILIGLVAYALTRLSLDRRIAYPILAALVLTYAVITDFTPSLLRAGGMLLLFYLSGFAKRQRDSVSALFASTSLIVTLSPRAILDIGLVFSFLATLGILILATPLMNAILKSPFWQNSSGIRHLLKVPLKALISASVMTLSATAFILPILTLAEGAVFLMAPLSNLLFAPIFTLLLYLLPIFLLTAAIPVLGEIVSLLIELLSLITASLSYLADIFKPFSLSLGYAFIPYLILLLFAIALPLLLYKKRAAAFLVLASFIVLAPLGIVIDDTKLTSRESVSFVSNGKNDLLFVEYEKNRLAVVFSASTNFTQNAIKNSSLSSPSVTLDTLFLPNPTNSQAILIYELWENGMLKHLILPKEHKNTAYLESFSKSLGIDVVTYASNEAIVYNGIAMTPHRSSTGTTPALSVKTYHRELLYLQENAPNDFDIRFGVMRREFDTVVLGTYGGEPKGSLRLLADEVWEYERRSYIVPQKSQTYRYGNRIMTDKREKQQ